MRHLSMNVRYVALVLLLAAIAFGVNWMAYEQHRANTGIFVPAPSYDATPYHRVDPPAPPVKSF